MPSIQVKDVPDDVHAVLRRRAAAAGQSMQEYLLAHLHAEAARPTMAEVFERVQHRTPSSLTLPEATASVRADRDRR